MPFFNQMPPVANRGALAATNPNRQGPGNMLQNPGNAPSGMMSGGGGAPMTQSASQQMAMSGTPQMGAPGLSALSASPSSGYRGRDGSFGPAMDNEMSGYSGSAGMGPGRTGPMGPSTMGPMGGAGNGSGSVMNRAPARITNSMQQRSPGMGMSGGPGGPGGMKKGGRVKAYAEGGSTYKRSMGIEEDKDSPAYYREKENVRMNKPGKYDSIRPAGEEQRLSKSKSEGLKQAAMGAGLAPFVVPAETVFGGRSSGNKGPIGAGAEQLAGAGDRLVKSTKEAADSIGGGIRQYKNAKSKEADLDRELDSQTKREARGKAKGGMTKAYAKGGMVSSASFRGDGIAQRGKTKGRMC